MKSFRFKQNKKTKTYTTFYQEIINYISTPETFIKINSCDSNVHKLNDEVIARTEKNLAEFLKKKPNTFNGNAALRIKNQEQTGRITA